MHDPCDTNAIVDTTSDASLDPRDLTPAGFIAAARQVRQSVYWEKKNLATYVTVTKHLLATAIENAQGGDEHAVAFRRRVLGLGYDLASLTWPGWDEEGIEVTDASRKTGLAAARLIVRVGTQHGAPPDVRHSNYWVLGAHLMADGAYDEALTSFERARDYSKEGGDKPDELTMLDGYIGLTRILPGRQDGGTTQFDAAVTALQARDNEDAAFYAKQLVTARAVFCKPV